MFSQKHCSEKIKDGNLELKDYFKLTLYFAVLQKLTKSESKRQVDVKN